MGYKSRTKLGLYLVLARRHAQLTSAELAKRIGISVSIISDWEGGYTKPKIENLSKIAEVLNLNMQELREVYDKSPSLKEIVEQEGVMPFACAPRVKEIEGAFDLIRDIYHNSDEITRLHTERCLEAVIDEDERREVFSYLLKQEYRGPE